jgi:hypothetical protein
MITPRQLTAIPTILGAHGVRDRDHRLAIISHIVGEPIASMKDLMRSEAGTVIDYLSTLIDGDEIAVFVETYRPKSVAA